MKRLQVLISVYGEDGIQRAAKSKHPMAPEFSYLLAWQTESGKEPLPEALLRPDMQVLQSTSKGLCRNRNLSLEAADGEILLIGDDDVDYDREDLQKLLAVFDAEPDLDMATFQFRTRPEWRKAYPNDSFSLQNAPKGYSVSSVEIAFRRKSVQGKIRFNEDYGIGGRLYSSGEESLFVCDALRAGLCVRYYPFPIADHFAPTTAQKQKETSTFWETKAAVIHYIHPHTWFFRLLLNAWRAGSGKNSFRFLRWGLKGLEKKKHCGRVFGQERRSAMKSIEKERQHSLVFPAEWEEQAFVQMTWPHEKSDWSAYLSEAEACFVQIAKAILSYEKLMIVCADKAHVRSLLGACPDDKVLFYELPTNDTWARDHGGISVRRNGKTCVYDFRFNAWGEKFAFDLDNRITARLWEANAFSGREYVDCLDFVLEGGSLETDGQGSLLTTTSCLLSEHRNDMDKASVESCLKEKFGLKRVLWIEHSYLEGDDTDGHIDMLARFCNPSTIAYVAYDFPQGNPMDDARLAKQKQSLMAMAEELKTFRQPDGKAYEWIPLPVPQTQEYEGEILPGSYANFLLINKAVLVPTYGVPQDEMALQQLKKAFPHRDVVGIDCRVLIRQHGSLHCSTMQFLK